MLTSNIKYWSWTGAFVLSLLFWAEVIWITV
ncbi:small membrane protein YmiC [Salmonella bongori]|nr:small membrane protein YmiC [Salmonella bongori]